MNSNPFNSPGGNQGLGWGFTTLLILLVVGAIAPDWLVNGVLIAIALVFLAPILGFFGVRWWIQRNLVTGPCPSCQVTVQGLRKVQMPCPNCGELIKGTDQGYVRVTPPGTVDVMAVDMDRDDGGDFPASPLGSKVPSLGQTIDVISQAIDVETIDGNRTINRDSEDTP